MCVPVQEPEQIKQQVIREPSQPSAANFISCHKCPPHKIISLLPAGHTEVYFGNFFRFDTQQIPNRCIMDWQM